MKRQPLTAGAVLGHGMRLLTIVSRASFWAVCYYYFGSKALLYIVAAWAFILGAKDLTFARVRLSNMARTEKRRGALAKSIGLELLLLISRVVVIGAIAWLLLPFNRTVAMLVAGLIPCALFWSRETLITLTNVYRVNSKSRYAALLSALSGLGAIVLFAQWKLDPVVATASALVIREAVTFFGYMAILVLGMTSTRFRHDGAGEMEEDEDDGGAPVPVIGADGQQIRSAFKIFIADNVVYSRRRMMQFGTRTVAHGMLGPFGGIATRLYFSYRKPGPYVHRHDRMPTGKVALIVVAVLSTAGLAAVIAEHFGLLHAFGIAVAGFAFRVLALSINLLSWRRLSSLVGSEVKIGFPSLPFRRSSAKASVGEIKP